MASTPHSKILEQLVRNTGADKEFALKLLRENNWQNPDIYKQIERLCLDSAQRSYGMQNHPGSRGTQIPVQHIGPTQRSLYGQRGGGAYPQTYTNTGVGRAGGSPVISRRPGYDTMPISQHSSAVPGFPVNPNMQDRRQIDPANRPVERIVPIQVERGAAVKLPTTQHAPSRSSDLSHQQQQQQFKAPNTSSQQQQQFRAPAAPLQHQFRPPTSSPQQQHRVLPTPQTQQGFRVPQVPLQRQVNVQETMPRSLEDQKGDQKMAAPTSQHDKTKETGSKSGGDHTPKLKRGISNIMENANLVSEARSSVLHDIEEDSHDHMYLLTFVLPDLTVYSEDFRAYLEKDLIETSTLVSLEQAGRLNWWAEMRICQRLLPMATSGDGNCLLHAASLAMWGIHDRQLILRNALYAKMTSSSCKDSLYRRWRWQQTLANKESGLLLSEEEWQAEWDNLLKLSSPTPRTFPETSKRNSCCDSPVTQGSSTSTDPVVYESLEEFHVFVLALVLQRPIVIVADTVLKDSGGEALAPIPFGGIYLPLECEAKSCYRSPLLLTYDAAHFSALVPMQQDSSPDEKPYLPAAIPLVDPSFQLLPLHFHVDPGPRYDWNKPNNKKILELGTEDKLNLLQQFMDVEKLQIPVLDADYDSDKQSCGSYESDDSVGCVGNKEKKKEAKVAQQMHSVAKQFGSIGKSMGKKIKKNFGSLGKAMKNIGDSEKALRRQSVGSVITQSTKVIATIATDIGRDRVWSAKLTVTRSKMQQELVKNYLQTTEQRFEKDRELWRKKNEEIRNRVSMHSTLPTVACVTPGCQMFGTAETAYLCSKCYSQQKQEALDKEKQKGQFVYNTFPGRAKAGQIGDDQTVKYGKSKFYTRAEDGNTTRPICKDSRLLVASTIDRQQSRSVGDVSSVDKLGHPARTPSPDYDNVDYKFSEFNPPDRSSYLTCSQVNSRTSVGYNQTAARPPTGLVQSNTKPQSCVNQPAVRPESTVIQSGTRTYVAPSQSSTAVMGPGALTGGQVQRGSETGSKCRTDGCDFYGSVDRDYLCSGCHKERQVSLQSQVRASTRL